jgi:uncharacterized protein YrrD
MDKNDAFIRATELSGRAVVDLDAAEKVGSIHRIVLDPDQRQVAGFLVARGSSVSGQPNHMTLPASAVRAIGPDAVTMHRRSSITDQQIDHLQTLPAASDLIGRKVVTEDGRMLGRVTDVLIERGTGRIVGYPIGHGDVLAKVEKLFGGDKHRGQFLAADADLRAGDDLIVAPEAALRDEWPIGQQDATPVATASTEAADVRVIAAPDWRDVSSTAATRNQWVRREPETSPAAPSKLDI